MTTARRAHTATLLANGQVLVVAASYDASSELSLASAELYNPVTGLWTATGSLHAARYLPTATLLPDGKVLIAGGSNAGDSLATAEVFDPATGAWTLTGAMSTARFAHTATDAFRWPGAARRGLWQRRFSH